MKDTKKQSGLHLVTNETAVMEAQTIFENLVRYSQRAEGTVEETENAIFKEVLKLGRALLQQSVTARMEEERIEPIEVEGGKEIPYHGQRSYRYVSIFGEIEVERAYFWSEETGGVAPLDEKMGRPKRCYSPKLEEWALRLSVVEPFEASVEWLNEQLGVKIPKRMVEVMSVEAAQDVRSFYESPAKMKATGEGECIVVSTDGKGIPMTKKELAQTPTRRKRGEKAQKKKMATVATVYTVAEQDRFESVTETGQLPDIAAHDKQIFAELEAKPTLTPFLKDQVEARGGARRPVAFLADGQPAMWGLKAEICPYAVEILDFHHAREYLWKAVYTFLPEGSEAATAWVKAQESRFLLGQVGLVIDELRHCLSTGLIVGKSKTETVHKVIAYFDTNRSRMRYDQYLRAGFPIGSGAVESACKQLIVTRMDGAGMRWTVTGAQAMLDLRSVFLNGDWSRYWTFHRSQEHLRLYGPSVQSPDVPKTEKKSGGLSFNSK
ncbi:MAG: ISKra4 family transposase [Acidobacteria bacterium]|nr:ISKra4 family transposase [Acidobacteriota bacterium]